MGERRKTKEIKTWEEIEDGWKRGEIQAEVIKVPSGTL
jgi:hypothetical protein